MRVIDRKAFQQAAIARQKALSCTDLQLRDEWLYAAALWMEYGRACAGFENLRREMAAHTPPTLH